MHLTEMRLFYGKQEKSRSKSDLANSTFTKPQMEKSPNSSDLDKLIQLGSRHSYFKDEHNELYCTAVNKGAKRI